MAGGYAPVVGNNFSVMSYTTRTGTIATISASNLPGGVDLQESYGTNELVFDVVSQ